MVEEPKVTKVVDSPTDEARREAKENPGGWVYQIDCDHGPDVAVPGEAIVGAWQVDENGEIIGDFLPNPNYVPSPSDVRADRVPGNQSGQA